MNFYEYLIENYGYDEPIFLTNLYEELDLKEDIIKLYLQKEVSTGRMSQYIYKKEIYFIPDPSSIIDKNTVSLDKIIRRKYINNRSKRVGYFTGLYIANKLGLTTQNLATVEIVYQYETQSERIVNFGFRKVILKKPRVKNITDDNYKLLQVMDLLNIINEVSEMGVEKSITILQGYLKDCPLSKDEIEACIQKYPINIQNLFYRYKILI